MWVRIPAPSTALLSNLLGLLGLAGIVVAAGGLTGNWWVSLLVGSVFLVGLSYVAHVAAANADAPPAAGEHPAARPIGRVA
ncbi:hypothetical protein [Allokutzneria albata]|uniref:Uncharacterized protein n=1 Tax=Allokutzneria albata TaxID=211114 RepID=A0A1H0DUG5_ALLAB|nr:hypothetical protein [Allokutzneria albata]SDN73641.1 hypothetical protein SAMN04489726_7995 [Allokutzneria albata]